MPRPPPLKLKDSLFVDEEEDGRLITIAKQDHARKKKATRLNQLEEKRLQAVLKQVEHTHALMDRTLRRQTRIVEKSLQKIEKRKDRFPVPRRSSRLDSITEEGDDQPPVAWDPTAISPTRKDRRGAPYGFSFQDGRRDPLGRWVRYPKRVELEAMSRNTTMLKYGSVLPPIGSSEAPPRTAQSEGGQDFRRLPTWLKDPVIPRPPTPKGEEVIPLPSVFKRDEDLGPNRSFSPTEYRLPSPKWL